MLETGGLPEAYVSFEVSSKSIISYWGEFLFKDTSKAEERQKIGTNAIFFGVESFRMVVIQIFDWSLIFKTMGLLNPTNSQILFCVLIL